MNTRYGLPIIRINTYCPIFNRAASQTGVIAGGFIRRRRHIQSGDSMAARRDNSIVCAPVVPATIGPHTVLLSIDNIMRHAPGRRQAGAHAHLVRMEQDPAQRRCILDGERATGRLHGAAGTRTPSMDARVVGHVLACHSCENACSSLRTIEFGYRSPMPHWNALHSVCASCNPFLKACSHDKTQ